MNTTRNNHLNEDQILTAIVDSRDLPVTAQKHLEACPQCRQAIENFDKDLSTLGQLARRFSPAPESRITLPVEKERASFLRAWKWQVSFGTAFSVLLIFGILWWSGIKNPFGTGSDVNLSKEMFEDEQLMTEITNLSENALPSLYMNIAGEPDTDTDTEEDDFINFIDPSNSIDDISMS